MTTRRSEAHFGPLADISIHRSQRLLVSRQLTLMPLRQGLTPGKKADICLDRPFTAHPMATDSLASSRRLLCAATDAGSWPEFPPSKEPIVADWPAVEPRRSRQALRRRRPDASHESAPQRPHRAPLRAARNDRWDKSGWRGRSRPSRGPVAKLPPMRGSRPTVRR